jgi:imidazolonepropionase-like amidohydrolase
VIRNVILIDGREAAAKREMTVIISDRHFTTIAPAAQAELPPDAEIIDAAGKFAIPGLWDMHVHLTMTGEVACPLLLANGITGVRDMGGSLEMIDWMRRRIGKAADLVLLDQNPLEDIANTRKISAVIANGRVFRRPELDAMLEAAAKEAPNR